MRNPSIRMIEPREGILRQAPKIKIDPLAHLLWRMFPLYARDAELFIVAKTQEKANQLFQKKRGLSAQNMTRVLLFPRERIAVIDGGVPNPTATKFRFERPAAVNVSPYRLFGFTLPKPREDACGRTVSQLFVIAIDPETAEGMLKSYGQCAVCICELLTLNRYIIQTTDGLAP